MGGDPQGEARGPREETGGPGPLADSDDTTSADSGLAGGTGASAGEATANPLGTQPLDDEADEGQGR